MSDIGGPPSSARPGGVPGPTKPRNRRDAVLDLESAPPRAPFPAYAPKPADIEAMRVSVNDAATISGGLWISYLFVMFYLTVAAGAVTHVDLFLERPVRLPFLSIDLPLLAFFCLSPLLFLIVHAYTLVHFVILSEKAKQFHQMLSDYEEAAQSAPSFLGRRNELRDNLRRQLPSNVFVQFLAGPPELRSGAFGWTLRAISWISLAVAPIFLLLLFQLQFLPYQNLAVTWIHRVSLMLDFGLLWWLWRKILSGRESDPVSLTISTASSVVGVGLTLLVVAFSCFIVVFSEEWQERQFANFKIFPDHRDPARRVSIYDFLFHSTVDEISRKRRLPFSNTLVLSNANLVDMLGGDEAGKLKTREFYYRARGRSFRGAIFDHALLPKVDFYGAHLEGASFLEAQLDQSSFDKAWMNRASLLRTTARSASFEDTILNGSDFSGANLTGADFVRASLYGASFTSADLSGAKFLGAKLNGANLNGAVVFGASFNCATMSAATLLDSAVAGSYFVSARLDAVDLARATISLSDFTNARLSRASAKGAKIDRLAFEGLSGDETPESVETQKAFAQAKVEDDPFRAALADLFKTKVCGYSLNASYFLNSEVFANLRGPKASQMIDDILSADCAAAAGWSPEERNRLRSRRDTAAPDAYRNKFLECSAFGP